MARCALAALSLTLLVPLAACPPKKPPTKPVARPPSRSAASAFAVAEYIPRQVSYVALTRSLSTLLDGLRGSLRPLRVLDRSLTPDRVDAHLRRAFGWNPLDLGELDDAGFDLDASAAIFASKVEPTILLPIKSVERLGKFLETRTKKRTVCAAARSGSYSRCQVWGSMFITWL